MGGARTARTGVLVALLGGVLLLLALTPGVALAAWTGAQATIVDPHGTGVVPLLNVSVANHATNDSSAVTTVQFSDDGQDWYAVPYTGEPCDWVLGGESGHKNLLVRFGAQDGSVSPVVRTGIDVDTAGPVTAARSVTRASRRPARVPLRGPRRRVAAGVRDDRGARARRMTRRYDLGRVRTGTGKAAPAAPAPDRVVHLARGGDRPGRVGAGTPGVRSVHGQVIPRPPRGARRGGPLKPPWCMGGVLRAPPIAASGGGRLRAGDGQERLVDALVAGGREVGRELAQQVRQVRLRGADLLQRLPAASAERRPRRAPSGARSPRR